MGYMPGLQSFEGLTEAGGFSSQMTHSPSCWQETSVLCHTDFFVRLYEERRGGKGGGAGRGDEEMLCIGLFTGLFLTWAPCDFPDQMSPFASQPSKMKHLPRQAIKGSLCSSCVWRPLLFPALCIALQRLCVSVFCTAHRLHLQPSQNELLELLPPVSTLPEKGSYGNPTLKPSNLAWDIAEELN
ncbi:uncharacterized protein [Macaca nemestrina]|uniref:uncharacterized protein isoform X1 n=1 Tax=Macaca nemestrina TaxID=9545 RepID=UPI0039B9500D